jgi:hypothetical protein
MRPLAARCHLGLGVLYGSIDDHERAKRHLTTAMTRFRETGMDSWFLRAERLTVARRARRASRAIREEEPT